MHDDTADALCDVRESKQHFSVGAPSLLDRSDPERVEPSRQCRDSFVGRQDSLPLGNQRERDPHQIVARQVVPPCIFIIRRVSPAHATSAPTASSTVAVACARALGRWFISPLFSYACARLYQ